MEIRQAMTTPVRTLRPSDTIAEAARLMARFDIGALPVTEGRLLKGMVTDRDIAVRAVAEGLDPGLPVDRILTHPVVSCSELACIDDVLAEMVVHGVRRMPICAADGALVGIVTIGDLARMDWDKGEIGTALQDLSRSRIVPAAGPAAGAGNRTS